MNNYIMKKLLTLFIWLFSIISFWNCTETTLVWTVEWNITSNITTNFKTILLPMPLYQSVNFESSNVIINFTNVKINWKTVWLWSWNASSDWVYLSYVRAWVLNTNQNSSSINSSTIYSDSSMNLTLNSNSYSYLSFIWISYRVVSSPSVTCNTNSPCPVEIDYEINYDNTYLYNPAWETACEWDIEWQLNTCKNDLATATWNLLTCQSDLNTCQNDLINCGEWNAPSCESWDIQRSSLFINDIQHESASNINITIPEEIGRDYTNDNDDFNLEVNWYNVDEEYIAQIIENEKMTPTANDFSYLIENLGDYIPLLCIAGLMITARYIIKKVF